KVREVVFDNHHRPMTRIASYGASDRYQSEDGETELIVEWHDLLDAQDAWSQAPGG
ncbi:unnamed protein product, partial [marine sediment metagenome]